MSEREAHRSYGQPSNDGSEDNIGAKSKTMAELALVYIGIPGATLYPLGLVALLIQVLRDPHFPYLDPVTAWTAVSLISQTVVIGTGIALAYLSLLAALLGMEVYYLTFTLLHKWHKRQGSGPESSSNKRESRRMRRWSLYLLPLLPLAMLEGVGGVNFHQPVDIVFLFGFILFSCGGGALAGYIRERRYDRGPFSGLVVAYIGAILAALCLSALSGPGLPQVEIDTAQVGAPLDCSEASGKQRFVMLSQNGPYLYVYNEGGLFAFTIDETEHIRYRDTLFPECPGEST